MLGEHLREETKASSEVQEGDTGVIGTLFQKQIERK
jgi:hypothetical protein